MLPNKPEPTRPQRVSLPSISEAGQRRVGSLLASLVAEQAPLDLRLLGRTILHAALVGAIAGLVAAGFFGALEVVEELLLHGLAGYSRLRAAGETLFAGGGERGAFRPWLLVILPSVGALAGGLLTSKLAPEARGGGGDAMIEAFHKKRGRVRKRVIAVKALASIATLGSGGSGGREGPTMHIGASIGSLVAELLKVNGRERRILLISGVAAGMSAIFRTPLGAALLATEVLYRDDFEADALVPALLASVVSYSIFISIFGESTLFAHSARFPFVPAHLPLYGGLAVLIAVLAILFLRSLDTVRAAVKRLPGPEWLRPAVGGLAVGAFVTPILWYVGRRLDALGQGFGMLGGGYGAAQVAMTGADWLPHGWGGVQILLLLCAAKLVCSSFTIGSGGSAGDFAPSLVLGGLFGGAFGRALQLLLHDPRIDPGAFALVGMGTFYGGVAHVPVSSLVMVCELAGSYDLLVPMMLAEAIAFVLLRKKFLYHAQVGTQRESPTHGGQLDVLKGLFVRDVMTKDRPFVSFDEATTARAILAKMADSAWQDVFPVLAKGVELAGVITPDAVRVVAAAPELLDLTVARELMQAPFFVRPGDNLGEASSVLLKHGAREALVLGADGAILGFLDEAHIRRAYLETIAGVDAEPASEALPSTRA